MLLLLVIQVEVQGQEMVAQLVGPLQRQDKVLLEKTAIRALYFKTQVEEEEAAASRR
jgi:hypothetical protein